jgi:reactive chlorine resistance protein C
MIPMSSTKLRMPRARFVDPPAVTAGMAARAPTIVGQFLIRYGLVVVLAWIGALKYFSYEAASIQPLIAHSPLLSWLYGIFDVRTLGYALGSAEITAAVLIALRPLWPRLSAVGSVFAVLIFCSTISFLFTTPGVTAGGFGLLSGLPGQFLIKDIVLLGVALWTLGDSLGAQPRTRSAA